MENNEKEVLFSVSHLKKYFQVGNHATLKAVDDVSFEIYKGETLGMVGESGCGKTTCGRTCIGILGRTDGHVLYKGKDVLLPKKGLLCRGQTCRLPLEGASAPSAESNS